MPERYSPENYEPSRADKANNLNNRLNKFATKHLGRHGRLMFYILFEISGTWSAKQGIEKFPIIGEVLRSATAQAYEKGINRDIQPLADSLRQEVGTALIDYLENMHIIREWSGNRKIKAEGEDRKVHVTGFESLAVNNQQISAVMEQTIPKFLEENTYSISFEQNLLMSSEYNLEEKNADGVADYSTKEIKISATKSFSASRIINSTLLHEIWHNSDWYGARSVPTEERLRLLQDIIQRVKSPDRYKSDYVESINNPDKQKELQYKATEYFAEVGSKVLTNEIYTIPKADRDLFRAYIKKHDPNFDWAKANRRRSEIVQPKQKSKRKVHSAK
ncbi:MAG: hypothetical protein JWO40_588 [Candidatus Doudnabacteria bacterium]|nr:hypothetical protein [Candidatus Doudnabacteria bacterium]